MQKKVKRMRTIKMMIDEIKQEDPGSCVTKYMIQTIIEQFNISFYDVGNKKLYDFDKVLKGLGLIDA